MSLIMGDGPVLCGIDNGVATLTLNRPDRLNAVNADMGIAFDRLIVGLEREPTVRVIVITGSGRGFCAGADSAQLDRLAKTPESLAARPPDAKHPVFEVLADAPPELRTRWLSPAALSKPVIAAINGPCAGVGLALACASDIRIASDTGAFIASFARRGLVAEAGLAWLLPRLVGLGHATDMLLSARKVGAEEAYRMGLVSAVVPAGEFMAAVLDRAYDIARNISPRSMAVIKRQIRDGLSQTLFEALRDGHGELKASLASPDFKESVAAAREKRPAVFPAIGDG